MWGLSPGSENIEFVKPGEIRQFWNIAFVKPGETPGNFVHENAPLKHVFLGSGFLRTELLGHFSAWRGSTIQLKGLKTLNWWCKSTILQAMYSVFTLPSKSILTLVTRRKQEAIRSALIFNDGFWSIITSACSHLPRVSRSCGNDSQCKSVFLHLYELHK